MYQLFLVMGGASTLILASLHIGILFIGPSAYEFLEAPQLAEMAANGAILPTFISLFFVFLFLTFLNMLKHQDSRKVSEGFPEERRK